MTMEDDRRATRASAQRERRKDELLDVSLEVFAKNGYHQTRISDIIAAANVARGTFYLYFESKSAIFLELLARLLSKLRASVVGVDLSRSASPVREQLEASVRRILETIAQNRRLTAIVIREAVGLDAEVDSKLEEFYGSLLDYIRDALAQGQRMGIVRPLDADAAALCILGGFKQLMETVASAKADAPPFDARRMAPALLDVYLRGVLATS